MNKVDIIPIDNGYIVRDQNSMGQKYYIRCLTHGHYYWTHDISSARVFKKETAARIAASLPSATEDEWKHRPMFDQIWTIIREYPARYSHILDVADKIFEAMKANGFAATIINYSAAEAEESVTMQIDSCSYRLDKHTRAHVYDLVEIK